MTTQRRTPAFPTDNERSPLGRAAYTAPPPAARRSTPAEPDAEATTQPEPPAKTPKRAATPRPEGPTPAPTADSPKAASSDDSGHTIGTSIPTRLYNELVARVRAHLEQPSYAQVVTWACEDVPEQVVQATIDHLLHTKAATGRAREGRRVPRGRPPRAEATVKLTMRFLPEELETLTHLQGTITAPEGTRLTRTAVICGALQAAFDHNVIERALDAAD